MTPQPNRRPAAVFGAAVVAGVVAGVVLLASACSHDAAANWPIPVPPEAELDARMRARIQGAVGELRAAPSQPERWLARGMTYEANELFAHAIECYGRALELAPSAKAWHRLACARASTGDTTAAVQAMRRSIELEPGYAPSHWRLGSALFDLGEFDEALRAFEEVMRLDPEHLGGPLGVARVHLQRGEPTKAIEVLERAARGRAEDRTLQRLLHSAYLQAGRAADAARIDVSPRGHAASYGRDPWQREFREYWERPQMEKALELLQAGEAARALEILEAFTAEAPDDLNACAYLAQAYLQTNQPAQARRVADEALARAPDNLLVLRVLARIHESGGRLDLALATLARIVEIDPNHVTSWRKKGRLEMASGQREAALASLRRAFALDQREPAVLVEIGALELGLERFEDAIRSFEQARRAGVQQPDLVLGLARAYARAGRGDEAFELVTRTSGLGRAGEVLLEELRAARAGAPR